MWLEVALTALWYRVAKARGAEERARDFLHCLPLGTCRRNAGREIAYAHDDRSRARPGAITARVRVPTGPVHPYARRRTARPPG
jgi:hypothetical protein